MSLDVEKFLFDTPLYTPLIIDGSNEMSELNKLNSSNRIISGYNPFKKIPTTFNVTSNFALYNNNSLLNASGIRQVKLKCKQYDDEFSFIVDYQHSLKTLLKIGQYPSVADFHKHELNKYSTILSKETLREFSRAIGLAANGIGIGSYVYLRRIFETLIKEASEKAILDNVITKEDFSKSRMEDKIELLKDYLPQFLTENKHIYSILSLGIHELDEQTCLEDFDALRIGIELILDEQLALALKNKKDDDAKKALNNINSRLKNKK